MDIRLVASSNRDLVVSLLPEIAGELSIAPRLGLFLSLGVEIPLNRVSYRYFGSERTEHLETAWAVQPRATLGMRVLLF